MTARDMARIRVESFIAAWRKLRPRLDEVASIDTPARSRLTVWIDDLDALSQPRQVIRTVEQLQGLPKGTKLAVQGDRAAQVEGYEDVDDNGEVIEVKKLLYVGTDLDDYLAPPDRLTRETLDTLRRMLPAIVIDPVE